LATLLSMSGSSATRRSIGFAHRRLHRPCCILHRFLGMSTMLRCASLVALVFVGLVAASSTVKIGGAKPAYKLMYFDAKGAAEISRVLMKIGGMEFEDYRFPITQKEGGGFETVEYTEQKTAGTFAANMNRVPLLSIDGELVGQSRAIERYVASTCNFMGCTDEERLKIDCVVENVRDIKEKWGKIRMAGGMGTNPEKDKAIEEWFAGGEFAEWLLKLEKSLPANAADDISVGSSISYADVCVWHLLRDYFNDHGEEVAKAEKKASCSKLTRIAQKVAELPKLKSWLADRPNTMF
jgi:glutathione S-transferase